MGSTLGRRVVHIANLSHQPCYLNHSVLCSFKWDLKNKSNKKITVEKKDLGLSPSLSFPKNRSSLQLNLMPSSSSFLSAPFNPQKMTSWNDNFPSLDRKSETCRVETRSFLKGINVNRFPSMTYKKEVRVSSSNNTISSISGKRSEREKPNGDDLDLERTLFRGISN
ncbi:hypothetical protein ACSBR1_035518 [Camellia fascicularis]